MARGRSSAGTRGRASRGCPLPGHPTPLILCWTGWSNKPLSSGLGTPCRGCKGPGAVPHLPSNETISGLTHQQACPDHHCRDQHPPRFPPALPCPAQATEDKEKAMGQTCSVPSPAQGMHCWHAPLGATLHPPLLSLLGWTPGGVERHPTLQDPSLQVGHCDLHPKQPPSPSRAAHAVAGISSGV